MQRSRKRLAYWFLFAVESAGMGVILYAGVPVYRRLLDEPIESHPAQKILLPILFVVAVMQTCYWVKRPLRPTFASISHPLLAHLLMFFSRLSFIFAAGLFSLTLYRRLTDLRESLPGVTVLLLATFAQFCYARELDILGQRVEKPTPGEPLA
ncbi:MAG TPA: hypothetical protein VGH97_09585 [Thermoanaerobaculia bacterium]|jgi:hypothetical protein